MAADSATAAAEANVVIKVEGVSKRYLIFEKPEHRLWQGLFRGRRQFYRDFWALHEISFEVRRGETVGIIGHNGSGKSTLLQIVCGTLTPTTGRVQITGRPAALLELGSGFNPEFTGRENVYLNGAILGLTRDQVDSRFDAIARFADIGRFIDQPVKTYSSGMSVRLAFAVIAHVDADLLVIDEALSVGDAVFTQKCMRFLRTFQEHGTILFVSHDTSAVLNLCQRALWLRQGRLAKSGTSKSVVEAYVRANIEEVQGIHPNAGSDSPPGSGELDGEGSLDATSAVQDPADSSPQTDSSAGPSLTFGAGGARITSVALVGPDGEQRSAVVPGEQLTLQVAIEAVHDVVSAIVGFHVKDRLGQVLFGDNTCLATEGAPVSLGPGDAAVARFSFKMPCLRMGKYTLDVAVADGTHYQHVQQHWFFDVTVIEVVTNRFVAGLFAVPEADVALIKETGSSRA